MKLTKDHKTRVQLIIEALNMLSQVPLETSLVAVKENKDEMKFLSFIMYKTC